MKNLSTCLPFSPCLPATLSLTACLFFALMLATGLFSVLPCSAQIQASQEPRHHIVFENALVRILDVRIPPGDTSLIHKHSLPSIFVVLSNTKTGSQVIVEPAKPHFTEGNIWFEGFYDQPRIHRVWNSDTTLFHTIDIELLHKTPDSIGAPLQGGAIMGGMITPLFDDLPVRGYRLSLTPHTTLRIPRRTAAVVVIGLTNPTTPITLNDKPFTKKGDFLFIPAGADIDFSNKGRDKEDFVLFELK